MNSTSDLYGIRSNGNSHGDVFTSPRVVNFMLDLIGYTSDRNLSMYKVLEPSFGYGDFLLEIQNRLIESASRYNFNATDTMSQNIYGCEIDKTKFDNCIASLQLSMPDFKPNNLKNEDFLFSKWDKKFDIIIGNPPYIRYENIPKDTLRLYKDKFDTFHYRCDLYVLFYEHCLKNLSIKGKHCFVCSNRWLKNEYGKKLRAMISSYFHLEYIIDIEKMEAFKESVLAYPTITLISNMNIGAETNMTTLNNLADLSLPLHTIKKRINHPYDWNNLFFSNRNNCFTSLEQQGFKIGIGVATGADKIFISTELKETVEEELLLPIVNAKDLSGNKFNWRGQYLLNPYETNGSLIDLDKYPKAKQYLKKNKSLLIGRHIVNKGRSWYSLIDKIKPNLVKQAKILLPDISGNTVIFIDKGSFYPAHNIYYITGKTIEDLEVLTAVLMSRLIREQLECCSNKMNGGFPRWQSQNLKKLRIPLISKISPHLRNKLVEAYYNHNFEAINTTMDEIVNLQYTENSHFNNNLIIPDSLFDYDFSDKIERVGLG